MDNQRALKLVASAALLVMLMFPALARAGFLASECDGIVDNLVLNCGFETGDFTDWTMTPAALGSHFGVESIHPHTGAADAFFMATGALTDSISQSIPTTPGAIYTVTFWLANDENSDIFRATFGATTLLSFSNMAPFDYTEYSQNVMATSASTLLTFSGSAPVDTLFLDDVSVVAAIPEPASLALLLSAFAAFGVVRRRLSKS